MKRVIITGVLFVITAFYTTSCANHHSLNKLLKTYDVKTPQACESKNGSWYQGKCWANFKEDDDGIPADEIDSVVEAQIRQIEQAKITINGHEYPIKMVMPEDDEDRAMLITVFSKNDSLQSLVIQAKREVIEQHNTPFTAEALLFDSNLIEDVEHQDHCPVATGKVTGNFTDSDDMNLHFNGIVKDVAGKEFTIDFSINDALTGAGLSTLTIHEDQAFLNGGLGTVTYKQIKDLITDHPEVTTLIFGFIIGSVNDAVNMHTGRLIRDAGLTTKVLADSAIASGGVDLFCAGKERIVTRGARIGVHSWDGENIEGRNLPHDHPAHQYQIDYFTMCLGAKGPDFYFYTLAAAPASEVHWMSEDEITQWGVATTIIDAPEPEITYPGIPDRLKAAGYSFGNPAANTVILNTQGGPATALYTDEFQQIFREYGGVDPEKIFCINVQQIQILKSTFFQNKKISFDEAGKYDKENIRMLAEIVRYFKSEGKNVILVGMSYGAFMVEDLLAEYGDIADKYLISGGRLDMPEQVWKVFADGNEVAFNKGIEIEESIKINDKDIAASNMAKLAAGYGQNRYTELLKDRNLSNVVYIYSTRDEAVGRLSDEEINFLKSKHVLIIKGEKGHMETMFSLLKKGFGLLLAD